MLEYHDSHSGECLENVFLHVVGCSKMSFSQWPEFILSCHAPPLSCYFLTSLFYVCISMLHVTYYPSSMLCFTNPISIKVGHFLKMQIKTVCLYFGLPPSQCLFCLLFWSILDFLAFDPSSVFLLTTPLPLDFVPHIFWLPVSTSACLLNHPFHHIVHMGPHSLSFSHTPRNKKR